MNLRRRCFVTLLWADNDGRWIRVRKKRDRASGLVRSVYEWGRVRRCQTERPPSEYRPPSERHFVEVRHMQHGLHNGCRQRSGNKCMTQDEHAQNCQAAVPRRACAKTRNKQQASAARRSLRSCGLQSLQQMDRCCDWFSQCIVNSVRESVMFALLMASSAFHQTHPLHSMPA